MSAKRSDGWLAVSLLGVQVFQQIGPNLAPVQTGALIDGYRLSASTAGTILGAETFGFAVAMILSAFIMRVASGRWLAVLSLTGVASLNFACVEISDPIALAFVRSGCGFLAGAAVAAGTAALASAHRVDRVTALLSVAIPLPIAAIIVVGSWAVSSHGVGWLFASYGVLALVAIIPSLALERSRPRNAEAVERVWPRLIQVVRSPAAMAWVIGFAGPAATWQFSERVGVKLGLSGAQVGVILAATAVPGVLGGAVALYLARPGRAKRLALVGLLCFGVASACLPLAPSPAAFIGTMTALTFFFVLCQPFLIDLVCEDDRSGGLAAGMFGWGVLATSVAPVGAGWLVEQRSIEWLFVIPVVTTIVAALLLARHQTARICAA